MKHLTTLQDRFLSSSQAHSNLRLSFLCTLVDSILIPKKKVCLGKESHNISSSYCTLLKKSKVKGIIYWDENTVKSITTFFTLCCSSNEIIGWNFPCRTNLTSGRISMIFNTHCQKFLSLDCIAASTCRAGCFSPSLVTKEVSGSEVNPRLC